LSLKLRISVFQSSRQSTEEYSVAPTIEDFEIKEEPEVDYDQTKEEGDGDEIESREGEVSGFRRHYRMGVRRAHIVRSVEVDGE